MDLLFLKRDLQLPQGYVKNVIDAVENDSSKKPIDPNQIGCDCYYGKKGMPVDYVKSFKWFYQGALEGDSYSMFNLAVCYYGGYGVEESTKKAVEWLEKARRLNPHPDTLRFLFEVYFYGEDDFDKDLEKAEEVARVEARHSISLHRLHYGFIALEKERYFEAIEWFRKAYHRGLMAGAYNLALMHFEGQGFPKGEGEYHGISWLRRAANRGYEPAIEKLREFLKAV